MDLLEALYQQVLIPPAVFNELEKGLSDSPIALHLLPWIVIARPSNPQQVEALCADLDRGEAEAIVLAIEHQADLLLVDERRGRRTAVASGVTVMGLLGVIAEAKHRRIIGQVKPVLDELIQVGRFWIGRALYAQVLTQVGED